MASQGRATRTTWASWGRIRGATVGGWVCLHPLLRGGDPTAPDLLYELLQLRFGRVSGGPHDLVPLEGQGPPQGRPNAARTYHCNDLRHEE